MPKAPIEMLKACRDEFSMEAKRHRNSTPQRERFKKLVEEIDATLRDWA